jgi:hypothetical protein
MAGESVFDVATPKVKKALHSMHASVDQDGEEDGDDDSFLDPAHKK